jgi:hypothetical protein
MSEFQMLIFSDRHNFVEGVDVAKVVLFVSEQFGMPEAMTIITDPRTERPMMFVTAADSRLLSALNLTMQDAGVNYIPLITL